MTNSEGIPSTQHEGEQRFIIKYTSTNPGLAGLNGEITRSFKSTEEAQAYIDGEMKTAFPDKTAWIEPEDQDQV